MPGPGHRQATPASQGFHEVNAPGQEGVEGTEQAQFHAAFGVKGNRMPKDIGLPCLIFGPL